MQKTDDVKVIIINPLDEKNNLTYGKINYIGDIDGYISHGDLMINYGVEIYGEDSIYEIMSDGNYLPIYPAFFLAEFDGNIVCLNISNNKIGKQGILYLPSDLGDEQIKSINSLSRALKGFNIEVNRDLELDDGLVDSSTNIIHCDGKSDIIPNEQIKVKKA